MMTWAVGFGVGVIYSGASDFSQATMHATRQRLGCERLDGDGNQAPYELDYYNHVALLSCDWMDGQRCVR